MIILNYNGLKFAEQCVGSVLDSDYPNFEVVVVDNGSTDGSYEVLCRSFGTVSNVRIVRNFRNMGFAQGNNAGYQSSRGDIVVFLNIDTKVERRWLRELVLELASDSKVGAAQSELATYSMDHLGFVYLRARGFSRHDAPQIEEPFYPRGASMAFRRSVLEETAVDGQPFDPDYFLYFEDNDLGWRVRLRGYGIVLVPSSILCHYGAGSTSSTSLYLRTFSFAKNRLMTLIKNYDLANLFRFLPLVVLLEAVHVGVLLPDDPMKSLAKSRALLWCFTNLRRIWRKRILVQTRIRTVPDSEVMRHMLRPNFSALRQTSGIPYY